MNAFNRFVMIIIALLLFAVPVLLLLVAFGVLAANQLGLGTISGALQGLPGVDLTSQAARLIVGIVSALLLLIALILIFRELTFGRPVARKIRIQDDPGKETVMTATAIKHLAEAVARESGAVSPTAKLASERDRRYDVFCDIEAPAGANVAELAARVRENIGRVFSDQRVPTDDVEVTVRGVAGSESGSAREDTPTNGQGTRQQSATVR